MKKLLSLLAAASLVATSSATVVACNEPGNSGGGGENLPDAKFELEKTSIEIDTKNPGYINITNWSVLNTRSKPQKYIYSNDGLVLVTQSVKGDQLIITPKSGEAGETSVTVESEVTKVEIKVKVKAITKESKFKLDKTELALNTSLTDELKIENWDSLDEESKPIDISFNKKDFATATLDTANRKIVVKAGSNEIEDLVLTVSSKDGGTQDVKIKIILKEIDLENNQYITNIAAGNMENGLIDPTTAIGDSGFKITDEAIVTGFNTMNGINISKDELVITRETEGNNGIGALVSIKGKEGSKAVKGELLLTLNQNIDPLEYFSNKNLGEIRLFEGAYNQLDKVLNSKDAISLGAVIFEQVGAKNTQLEYIKTNFIKNLGAAGQAVMKNAKTTATTFQITNMPTLNGIFKEGVNVEFTYRFVKEDRITLWESLPQSKKVKIDLENLKDKSKSAQKKAKEEVYNQLSPEFKSKIELNHFIEFTNIIFNTKTDSGENLDFKFDVLPGSDKLYGHDGAAYIGYINNPGGLAGASGGGNLEKYEDEGKLDDKYKKGMGYFSLGGSTSGNFYQGHDIIELKQSLENPIPDQKLNKDNGEGDVIEFKVLNISSKSVLTVESSNETRVVATLEKDSSSENKYLLRLKTNKNTGKPKITIKLDGFTIASFIAEVIK